MKYNTKLQRESRVARFSYNLLVKSLIVGSLILTGVQATAQPKSDSIVQPKWWFGVAGGANLNYYRGTTQDLNTELTVPKAFRHGMGVGLYLAPLVEYHNPDSIWGIMLQVGYDSRKGKFEQVTTPCNCPADLSTKLNYITIEPSIRIAPFKSNFYLYGGPRLAFGLNKSFEYQLGINPSYPNQAASPAVKGEFSDMKSPIISMQIGAGYDIPLTSKNNMSQFVLSPFVAYHPYFGQNPRSIETWNLTTIRVGAALKFGRGSKKPAPEKEVQTIPEKVVIIPTVQFLVVAPKNIPVERRVRETFPIRNYVFFDLGSSEIPDRYVLLKKNQVKEFKEDQLEVFTPKRLSGRSGREMTVYYNILNILGDRMGKYPTIVIRLTGASMEGEKDGLAMAGSVKKYLVDVFGIDASRINTEGRIKPRVPSEQPGGTKELVLLREGDRRVSIWSESPAITMEFQSGPDAPLKPVEIIGAQEVPIDAYLTFEARGSKIAYSSWSIEVSDSKGIIQKFGPYTIEKVGMRGRNVLGTKPEGNYKVTMIGTTKSGKTVKKDTTVHMVLWKPSEREEGMRYSVIYEFNESKSIAIYDKYLTEIVTPKIPKEGTVVIHGYTDIIGDPDYNQRLSLARANDVRDIIEKALAKANRTDVTFEVYGFGEDDALSPFENTFPEERFYNRTVIIDLIPKK